MATLDSSEIVSYDAQDRKLVLRFVIDGAEHIKEFNNTPDDSTLHNNLLTKWGTILARRVEERAADDSLETLRDAAEWNTLPESTQEEADEKQRIAQVTVREAAETAKEGLQLEKKGRTRHEAASHFFYARKLLNKIIPHLTGNAAAKRTYLNLTAAEWSSIRDFHTNITDNTSAFSNFINYMAQAPNVVEIDSEVNV